MRAGRCCSGVQQPDAGTPVMLLNAGVSVLHTHAHSHVSKDDAADGSSNKANEEPAHHVMGAHGQAGKRAGRSDQGAGEDDVPGGIDFAVWRQSCNNATPPHTVPDRQLIDESARDKQGGALLLVLVTRQHVVSDMPPTNTPALRQCNDVVTHTPQKLICSTAGSPAGKNTFVRVEFSIENTKKSYCEHD